MTTESRPVPSEAASGTQRGPSVLADRRTAPAGRSGRGAAVVVGVDGFAQNAAAVEYAAQLAVAEGRPLTLLTIVEDAAPVPGHVMHAGDTIALERLEQATRLVQERHPGLPVSGELTVGDAMQRLLDRSAEQALLVVGKHGPGPPGRSLLGSTSIGVAAGSRVPVLVVPPGWNPAAHTTEDIVVTDIAEPVLRRAFVLAARARVRLRVVLPRELTDRRTPAPPTAEFPDVPVDVRPFDGPLSSIVGPESRDSQLLVLGRSDHEAVTDFQPGALGRAVLRRAELPVLVVPRPRHPAG